MRKRLDEALVTRRGFVLGGLAAAIAGLGGTGVAATQPRGRRLLHTAGLLDRDEHPAPPRRAKVEYRRFESEKMRRPVAYAVARPPDSTGRLPVVYCLHGRGADDTFATETIRLQDFLAAAGVPIAVVSPDGGPDNSWHPRRSGENPLAMLVDELIPAIDAELGDGRRGLLGWSMGGYGALLAAERRPELFAGVALASPALWRTFAAAAPGAFDDERDFRTHDVFTATDRLDGLALRADIGRDDPFVGAFRDLERLLPDAAFRVTSGFHDAAYWRSLAPAQVAFFARHLT